jgi:sec-independent protein translocase protein TatB
MQWPGFWELLMLGVIALLIFGPDRLPGMAYKAGQMISRFKSEAAGTLDELKAAAELESFSDVARELREGSDELRRTVDVRGMAAGVAGAIKPQSAAMATAPSADVAPPFDPDTP